MGSVIVAHGLWMPGWETVWLRRRLRAAGLRPYLFRFRTVRASLAENVEALGRFAARVPGETLDFVGYSLGGVVMVKMLAAQPPGRPGRIVCLGAPLNGSAAARALARLPGGKRVLGRSMLDLIAGAGVPPWAGPHELGVVAGKLSVGLGRLLGALPEPNDGTVAVEETQLRGAQDHIVLPVSHTTLLLSRAVAAQAVHFLTHGHFAR